MSRHEIRFRRKMMTSRRMGRHKDYNDILRKHGQRNTYRKMIKIVAFVVLLLLFIYMVATLFDIAQLPIKGNSGLPGPDTAMSGIINFEL